MSQPDLPEIRVKTKHRDRTKTRRVPPYILILENDDLHSMEFVVEVLVKTLGYAQKRCVQLMMQAHSAGRAIVWTGPKEVAELKADQIQTFHEIRAGGRDLGPVGCTIEPAPE